MDIWLDTSGEGGQHDLRWWTVGDGGWGPITAHRAEQPYHAEVPRITTM